MHQYKLQIEIKLSFFFLWSYLLSLWIETMPVQIIKSSRAELSCSVVCLKVVENEIMDFS